jgi:hypothetical protein
MTLLHFPGRNGSQAKGDKRIETSRRRQNLGRNRVLSNYQVSNPTTGGRWLAV